MGLPPFTTKGSTDSTPKVTFELDTPDFIITHAGVKATLSRNVAVSSVQTTTYSVLTTDYTVLVDGAGGSYNVTLPTAIGATGKQYIFKRVDQTLANTVSIVTSGGQTIDGSATKNLSTQFEQWAVVSDGTNWQVIGHSVMSQFTPFTPVLGAGWGVPVGTTGLWRRVGDSLDCIITFTAVTTTAGSSSVGFPIGIVVASSIASPTIVGYMQDNISGDPFRTCIASTSNGYIEMGRAFTTTSLTTALSPNNIAPTMEIQLQFKVPIQNWEG